MNADQAKSPNSALLSRPTGRWRTILIGLVIFLSGSLVGAGVAVLSARRLVHNALLHPEEISRRLAGQMAHRLDLSPDQEREVRGIITRRHERMLALRGEFRPRLEEELSRVREEIAEVLDERQERIWSSWFDRRCRSWLPGWHPMDSGRRPPPMRRHGMGGPWRDRTQPPPLEEGYGSAR